MQGREDFPSEPTRRLDEGGAVTVQTGSAVDPSLVAMIRRALETSGNSTHPEGSEETDRGGGVSVGRIGKFEVLGEIGRGGFGTVLRVLDPDLGRERALKVPNPATLGSPEALARFLTEARLAARIDHPNVVRIHEAATLGAVPYIVMEYCPDGSLGRWLAERAGQGPLPQRWAARLVAEIAEGVHQAHRAGLLHRDIKPANVLLERVEPVAEPETPRFRPKIADFGLAKVLEPGEVERSMTAVGTPVGTWAYMSPEQARGDREIGATTDVYAIGAILHELLTGRRLHIHLNQPEILARLLGPDPIPSPRATRKDLHRDLETICRKCLEKRPIDRYQNASELTNDLQRYLDGLPILARPAPPWRLGLSMVKRHPVRSALAGLIVAVGLAWSNYREMTRRGEVEILLNRVETAAVDQFPELIRQLDPADPRVVERLRNSFVEGGPTRKLAAALVLARVHPRYRDYAYDQLLLAGPGEIGSIARVLRERMADLPARLADNAEAPAPPGISPGEAEVLDHRRANAANALIVLEPGGAGWRMFRFQPDPQARTFLIHQIGASKVAPRSAFDRLKAEPDPTIRRALIQALGEMPEASWDPTLRAEVGRWAVGRYEHDPDPGVHGSCKWLLRSWKLDESMRQADARLARLGRDPTRRWRVGTPLGLTFVRFEVPGTGRVVEIADTEVTVAQILRWREVNYYKEGSPGPDHPINGSSYLQAAEFLNWLSGQDGVEAGELAYRAGSNDREPALMPVDRQLDHPGYRLPTDREFEAACRAGTTTTRYHGSSPALLSRYAWFVIPPTQNQIQSKAVGLLKPNDFGLFDMLGNVGEICQSSDPAVDPKFQAVACGGSVTANESRIKCDEKSGRTSVKHPISLNAWGFRVASTVRP